jgi:outer membrane murein-binding lipoprotein Lpp
MKMRAIILSVVILAGCSAVVPVREYNLYLHD